MTKNPIAARLLVCGALLAALGLQPVLADDFPADAKTPSAAGISTLFAGKTWIMTPARGGELHLEHAADGKFQIFVGGKSDQGTWRAEDGKMCYELTKFTSACNEVRLAGKQVLFKRSSGEVAPVKPK
ncbi:MAG: hypothetical protein HKUEN07_35620 [Rhodocyclaceae bacterium]|nr:MAG: hypothetical protein HKUEN07_35620 [Rhodocyclaceae bacterium]